MEREQRLDLIRQIESLRDSTLICYIAGDRENVSTRIAPDAIRVMYRHLELLDKNPRLELFLYTRGGDVLTPWRMINLFNEYTSEFNLIVPFRAYSAGTLISLGANKIIMGKMGELGPIDPVVANAFNPKDPTNPGAKVPISVEDVSSYLTLAEEKGHLKEEDSLIKVFSYLSENVHPLSLGNVHRNYQLIRSMARKLLKLSDSNRKESEINAIVDYLTKNLYAHNYMIPRNEARDEIGLNIIEPSPELEDLIWKLYSSYESILKLREPFTPLSLNKGREQNYLEFNICGGIIESREALDSFMFKGAIEREMDSPNKYDVNIISQKWERRVG